MTPAYSAVFHMSLWALLVLVAFEYPWIVEWWR